MPSAPRRMRYPIRQGVAATGLLLLLAASVQGQATESLTGRVVDIFTRVPVQGARVTVEEANGVRVEEDASGLRAVSGPEGRFVVFPVPEGRIRIRVEHPDYGVHRQDLRVEGTGTGAIDIHLSPFGIELAPMADGSPEEARTESSSSRNVITRDVIDQALAVGADLSDLLRRNIAGITVRRPAGAGGLTCIEFRGARRDPNQCHPPALLRDGIPLSDPNSLFSTLNISDVEEIRVIPPSQAGARYGMMAGWGVVLLTTQKAAGAAADALAVVRRTVLIQSEWSEVAEGEAYPWLKVYSAAFLGNALGLAAGAALLNKCMNLSTRSFRRGDEYCGGAVLLGAGLTMALLPPLAASLSARFAGSTERSRGSLRRSIAYSMPVFVPGMALTSVDTGSGGLSALDLTGLALVIVVAPILNTVADRMFRQARR